MSNGKENFTLVREDNGNESQVVQTIRGVNFAHQSPGGESELPFGALIDPPEYLTSGLTNPSSTYLLNLALSSNKANFKVTSSLGYEIIKSEYKVTDSAIVFKTYTTSANEILEVSINNVAGGGQQVVDARSYGIVGDLPDTTDEFDIGIQADVLKFETSFTVFRSGQQIFQADNNDNSGATGNYYILDPDGDGYGSMIKFFDAAIGDEGIKVVSVGGVVDAPNVSTFQEIDFLAGQLDAVIPTVAALAGVPESNFRAAPARPNLVAFQERVLDIESGIVDLQNNKQDKLHVGLGDIPLGISVTTTPTAFSLSSVSPVGDMPLVSGGLEIQKTARYKITVDVETFGNAETYRIGYDNTGVITEGPDKTLMTAAGGSRGNPTQVFLANLTAGDIIKPTFYISFARTFKACQLIIEEC